MTSIRFIGQSGVVVTYGKDSVVIDPYLSDSVANRFGAQFRRQLAVPEVSKWAPDLKCILLTHAHLDHTDPTSIRLLLRQSPQAVIYAPLESRKILERKPWAACASIRSPHSRWFKVAFGIKARSVPAAHICYETCSDGRSRYVGYCLKVNGKLIYHAGDTVLHPRVMRSVKAIGRPDLALIPVNERNYYREKRGIIGNLTVREALGFAQEIGAKLVIPIHWDMFSFNGVLPEEIRLLRSKIAPKLQVRILRCGEAIGI
jgi:L-ascorbate metabolism protein UlaG (beta-lactamase superfamily)